jgi:hypothetical protein
VLVEVCKLVELCVTVPVWVELELAVPTYVQVTDVVPVPVPLSVVVAGRVPVWVQVEVLETVLVVCQEPKYTVSVSVEIAVPDTVAVAVNALVTVPL